MPGRSSDTNYLPRAFAPKGPSFNINAIFNKRLHRPDLQIVTHMQVHCQVTFWEQDLCGLTTKGVPPLRWGS